MHPKQDGPGHRRVLVEPFDLPFVQRGLLMLAILAVPAGLLGTWIILRGLTFFSHAIATATFPGLVLAGGLGFSPILGALGAAGAFAAATGGLRRESRSAIDSLTALMLVAFLAIGVILASDVFGSGSNIDQLLFGSIFLIGTDEILIAGLAAIAALAATATIGARWLAAGFDPSQARRLKSGALQLELVLLALVALTTAAMLPAIGALLTGALFIVPAATVRLLTDRIVSWQVGSVLLVLAEGIVGLRLSIAFDAPPGPVIAALTATIFAVVVLSQLAVGARPRRAATAR